MPQGLCAGVGSWRCSCPSCWRVVRRGRTPRNRRRRLRTMRQPVKLKPHKLREPPGRSTSIKTTSIPPACTARAGSCGSAPSPASLFLWPDLRRSPCRVGGALPGRFPTSVRHRVPRALSPCSGQGVKHAPQRRRTHPRLRA